MEAMVQLFLLIEDKIMSKDTFQSHFKRSIYLTLLICVLLALEIFLFPVLIGIVFLTVQHDLLGIDMEFKYSPYILGMLLLLILGLFYGKYGRSWLLGKNWVRIPIYCLLYLLLILILDRIPIIFGYVEMPAFDPIWIDYKHNSIYVASLILIAVSFLREAINSKKG